MTFRHGVTETTLFKTTLLWVVSLICNSSDPFSLCEGLARRQKKLVGTDTLIVHYAQVFCSYAMKTELS